MADVHTRIIVSARDTATGTFRRAGLEAQRLKERVLSVNGALAAFGVGVGLQSLVQQTAQFERNLTNMAKVTSRDLGLVRKEILDLPEGLGSASELMEGYYQTISAGVTDPAQALETLTVASKAAKAAHVQQGEVIKVLTKTMAGFGGSVQSAAEASDLLFAIEKEGQTNFGELVPIMGDLATLTNAVAGNSHELGGALALLTQTAGSASVAGTQYKAVLMGLLAPSTDLQKLLHSMGYADGKALVSERGLVGALKTIQAEAARTGVAMTKLFGSQEAIIGLEALRKGGFEEWLKKIAAMQSAVGSTDAAYARWAVTLDGLYATAKNTVGKFAVEFGTEMAPTIKAGLEEMTGWLQENRGSFAEWADTAGSAVEGVAETSGALLSVFNSLPDWIKGPAGVGLVGGLLFGPKGAAMLASASLLLPQFEAFVRVSDAYDEGRITLAEAASMGRGAPELDDTSLDALQRQLATVRGNIAEEQASSGGWLMGDNSYLVKLRAVEARLQQQIAEQAIIKIPAPDRTKWWGVDSSHKAIAPPPLSDPPPPPPPPVSGTEKTGWEKYGIYTNSATIHDLNSMVSPSERSRQHDAVFDEARERVHKKREEDKARNLELERDFTRELLELSGRGADARIADIERQAALWREAGVDAVRVEEWKALKITETSDKWQAGATRGLRDYAEAAGDAARGMERVMTGAFTSMEDSMVRVFTTGKMSFSDMANSIISDIARMTIRSQVTGPLAGFLGKALGSMFAPAGNGATTVNLPDGGTAGINASGVAWGFHSGGVVGLDSPTFTRSVPASLFADAPRYHTGGVVGMNEVPAILQRGEGVFTREQMQALGAGLQRSEGIQSVRVEVINESGQQMQATGANARMDGTQLVISAWLRGWRDNMMGIQQAVSGA